MGHEFPFGAFSPENRTTFLDAPLLPEILRLELAKKFVFHLLSNRIFRKLFVNGKPTFATPFSFPDLGKEESRVASLFSLGLFSRRSYYLRDWQRLTGTKHGFIGLHISDPVHTLFY